MIDWFRTVNKTIHYRCDECNYDFGELEDVNPEWEYCPKCACPLHDDKTE